MNKNNRSRNQFAGFNDGSISPSSTPSSSPSSSSNSNPNLTPRSKASPTTAERPPKSSLSTATTTTKTTYRPEQNRANKIPPSVLTSSTSPLYVQSIYHTPKATTTNDTLATTSNPTTQFYYDRLSNSNVKPVILFDATSSSSSTNRISGNGNGNSIDSGNENTDKTADTVDEENGRATIQGSEDDTQVWWVRWIWYIIEHLKLYFVAGLLYCAISELWNFFRMEKMKLHTLQPLGNFYFVLPILSLMKVFNDNRFEEMEKRFERKFEEQKTNHEDLKTNHEDLKTNQESEIADLKKKAEERTRKIGFQGAELATLSGTVKKTRKDLNKLKNNYSEVNKDKMQLQNSLEKTNDVALEGHLKMKKDYNKLHSVLTELQRAITRGEAMYAIDKVLTKEIMDNHDYKWPLYYDPRLKDIDANDIIDKGQSIPKSKDKPNLDDVDLFKGMAKEENKERHSFAHGPIKSMIEEQKKDVYDSIRINHPSGWKKLLAIDDYDSKVTRFIQKQLAKTPDSVYSKSLSTGVLTSKDKSTITKLHTRR